MIEELKNKTIEEQINILSKNLNSIEQYTDNNELEDYFIGIIKSNLLSKENEEKFNQIYLEHILKMIQNNSNYFIYMITNYKDIFKNYLPKIYEKQPQIFKNINDETINILMDNDYYEFINVLPDEKLEKYLDKIIEALDEKKYVISELTPDYIKYNKQILYRIMHIDSNKINIISKDKIDENTYNELIKIAIKYGNYNIDENSPEDIFEYEIIKFALEKGQYNAIDYIPEEIWNKYSDNEKDELLKYSVYGYSFNEKNANMIISRIYEIENKTNSTFNNLEKFISYILKSDWENNELFTKFIIKNIIYLDKEEYNQIRKKIFNNQKMIDIINLPENSNALSNIIHKASCYIKYPNQYHEDYLIFILKHGDIGNLHGFTDWYYEITNNKKYLEYAINNESFINFWIKNYTHRGGYAEGEVNQRILKIVINNKKYLENFIIKNNNKGMVDYIINQNILDEKLLEILILHAIENGYIYSWNSPEIIKQFKYINHAIKYGQLNLIDFLDINNLDEQQKKQLEESIYKGIDNGYKIDGYSPKIIRQFKYIKYAIEKGQGRALYILDINSITEEEMLELENLVYKAIDNGYEIKNNSPKILKQFKYIKYAMEKGQINVIGYLDIENLTKEESLELEDLVYKAIDNGYKIDGYSPKIIRQFKYIKYAIEKGQGRALSILDINSITEEEQQELEGLVYKAIDNGYIIYDSSPQILKQYKYIKYAIEKGQYIALESLDINSITEEEQQELEGLIYKAIDNGYQINNYSTIILKQYKYIKYAIEKGQTTAILYTLQEEIENNTEEYKQLCYKALEQNGALFSKITILHSDKKALEIAIKTYPNAIELVDDSLITDDILEQIKDFNSINLQNLSLKTLIKILNLEKFNYNSNVLQALISHINELDINFKFDEKTTNIILKSFTNDNFNKCFSLLEHIEKKYMSEEFKQIFENSKTILKEFGKINTLEKNPVFSYDFIKYIYPVFGLKLCKDLLKYNSGADEQIIKQIKEGNINLIVDYYNKICPKLFNYSDKTLHFAFRHFDTIQDLVTDIIKNNIELSKEDLINLKKIIYNSNRYNIKTVEQLKNYKTTIENEINSIIESTNVANIKEFLSKSFGYNTLSYMKATFTNFQLDNFHKLNFVIESIKKSKILEPEQLEKYMLTEAEEKIILLMKEIIETENIEELQQLVKDNIANNKEIMDYSDDVDRIINKIRNIYNLQFQTKLTDVKSLQSKKTSQTKTITIYNDQNDKIGHQEEVNYEIIDMDSEKFNFLAHRIYHYDPKMREFCEMLMNNPKLWTKLDGASTLSTSSISDKGFWMLHSNDNSGVIYLFNNLTENFMLFMYGRDLSVEHGGHKLEPTSSKNYFTDIEGLSQASLYRDCSYNEVAGMREGMMPCAIACVGNEPNEAQIRAAAYFKIPIIRFNIKAYEEQNIENYKKAKEDFKTNPTTEKLDSIFLSGNIGTNDEELDTKCKYCFNILKEKYQNKEITQEEFIQQIAHIQSLLDRICDAANKDRNLIRKTELFIETFCSMQQIAEEELIKLETANMGESGVMFKYQEGNKEYLLKPAVDKKEMKPQNFRAQIQKSASVLQKIISEDTAVEVDVIGDKTKLSKQEKIELSENKDALTNWVDGTGTIEKKQTNQLLQEYVVDFLLCNFDCFDGNFIIDKNNNVRGIDKEQSFRFIDNEETLRPDFSYVPNGLSRIPIYKIMFEKYKKGDIELDFNIFDQTIAKVKNISDEQYKNIFRGYAESINPRNPENILEKILERKHKCTKLMEEYINSIRYLHQSEEESQNERTR